MTRFEGLQLSQLLDLMHDLVRPEPIQWTPQTIGWAVVGVWLLCVIAIVLWHSIRRWRRNRYRRAALAELDKLQATIDLEPDRAAVAVATLLKRTALVAYDRSEVASLSGEAWAEFLCRTSANDPVVTEYAAAISSAAYDRRAKGAELIAPARRWVKVHRA